MSAYRIPRLASVRVAIDKVNEVIGCCKSFKIGKTHDLTERLQKPDSNGVYPFSAMIYSSSSKELTSYVEAILIDACKTEIPELCDNNKDGDRSINDSMPDSDMYCVYIVWR